MFRHGILTDRRITGLSRLPEERRIDMAVSSGILVEVFLMIVFGGIEILQLLDLDCHAAPQFPLQTVDTTRDNITVREVCIVYAGTVLCACIVALPVDRSGVYGLKIQIDQEWQRYRIGIIRNLGKRPKLRDAFL